MWLIAVALPIQGVAAATMLHCGSAQGQAHAKLMHEGHADHDAADGATGQHHDGGTAGCSACASCCSAVALPVMPLILASQELTEAAAAVSSPAIVVFLTDGPERPPRTILA